MTVLVVVATGNHYWGDGIVAGALLIAAFCAQWGMRKLRQKRVTARKDLTKQDAGRGGLVDVR